MRATVRRRRRGRAVFASADPRLLRGRVLGDGTAPPRSQYPASTSTTPTGSFAAATKIGELVACVKPADEVWVLLSGGATSLMAAPDGTIRHIHEEAVPLDTTPIRTPEEIDDILFVLEINGGLSQRLGIEPGDVIQHPLVGEGAALPCD